MTETFLLEIGCEEIPARHLDTVLEKLRDRFRDALVNARLPFDELEALGTMRRIALIARGLPREQLPEIERIFGPSAAQAFDSKGHPTEAATGFAAAKGVSVEDLKVVETERDAVVAIEREKPAQPTATVLQTIIPKLFSSMSLPILMRWDSEDMRFIRPIRSLTSVYRGKVLSLRLGGVEATSKSFGHRIRGKATVSLSKPEDYGDVLLKQHVLVATERRIHHIQQEATRLAEEIGGQLLEDEELLRLIANMVEYPEVFRGAYSDRHLSLPLEVLITSMREHQKHFSIVDANGQLKASFIGVLDTEVTPEIVENYEWVLEARLIDSAFFFHEDQKRTLVERREDLRNVIYRKGLGSYWEKTSRLEALVQYLAEVLDASPSEAEDCQVAASLSKSDLTTQMVGEFPSLQGIMGGIYARGEEYGEGIWRAIHEQYRPEQQKSELPETVGGQMLALADKIDNLVGTFGLNIIPTGSRDPYGARRAANGILRILVKRNIRLSLRTLVEIAYKQYRDVSLELSEKELQGAIARFLRERLVSLLQDDGYPFGIVAAVLDAGYDDVAATFRRAEALQELQRTGEIAPLATAFKRLTHIVDKTTAQETDPGLFEEEEEKALYQRSHDVAEKIQGLLGEERFSEALQALLSLRKDIDRFFDRVLVNVETKKLRENRIALVQSVADIFSQFADFSYIED